MINDYNFDHSLEILTTFKIYTKTCFYYMLLQCIFNKINNMLSGETTTATSCTFSVCAQSVGIATKPKSARRARTHTYVSLSISFDIGRNSNIEQNCERKNGFSARIEFQIDQRIRDDGKIIRGEDFSSDSSIFFLLSFRCRCFLMRRNDELCDDCVRAKGSSDKEEKEEEQTSIWWPQSIDEFQNSKKKRNERKINKWNYGVSQIVPNDFRVEFFSLSFSLFQFRRDWRKPKRKISNSTEEITWKRTEIFRRNAFACLTISSFLDGLFSLFSRNRPECRSVSLRQDAEWNEQRGKLKQNKWKRKLKKREEKPDEKKKQQQQQKQIVARARSNKYIINIITGENRWIKSIFCARIIAFYHKDQPFSFRIGSSGKLKREWAPISTIRCTGWASHEPSTSHACTHSRIRSCASKYACQTKKKRSSATVKWDEMREFANYAQITWRVVIVDALIIGCQVEWLDSKMKCNWNWIFRCWRRSNVFGSRHLSNFDVRIRSSVFFFRLLFGTMLIIFQNYSYKFMVKTYYLNFNTFLHTKPIEMLVSIDFISF